MTPARFLSLHLLAERRKKRRIVFAGRMVVGLAWGVHYVPTKQEKRGFFFFFWVGGLKAHVGKWKRQLGGRATADGCTVLKSSLFSATHSLSIIIHTHTCLTRKQFVLFNFVCAKREKRTYLIKSLLTLHKLSPLMMMMYDVVLTIFTFFAEHVHERGEAIGGGG